MHARWLLPGLCLLLAVAFTWLGVWQLERRAWKLDLIARVEQRLHTPPTAVPGPAEWPTLMRAQNEYQRLTATGEFSHASETLVLAVTEKGRGHWVLTPFKTAEGFTVLVNRGFVDAVHKLPATRAAGQVSGTVTVSGLLRFTEPGGGFLRTNNPAEGRWFSRDVQAIAATQGLANPAPYFIDADAVSYKGGMATPGSWPVGGLTVVSFRNSHLVYALTWFCLASMSLLLGIRLLKS